MSKNNQFNGATHIISTLASRGVRVCFANPGTTEMELVGALDTATTIPNASAKGNGGGVRPVLCLHETVCAGAADGYARMMVSSSFEEGDESNFQEDFHEPGCVLLHLGPGLANALANLHNARRASVPLLVLVGDFATWHRGSDAPLEMDIEALAWTVSRHVKVSLGAGEQARDAAEALLATQHADMSGGSRISTLIVPHDRTWEKDEQQSCSSIEQQACEIENDTGAARFMKECGAALMAVDENKAAIFLGGEALYGENIIVAGRIASMTGAILLAENSFARIDRGNGIPKVTRVPYFPQEASKFFAKYKMVVTIGARHPVAQFGYRDGPSKLLLEEHFNEDNIWEMDAGVSVSTSLRMLSEAVSGVTIPNLSSPVEKTIPPSRPPMPTGKLTANAMCTVIANVQPINAVVVDESLTSGTNYWDATENVPPFSHLALTGGAIGQGIPCAVGAAIACPDRRVINIQADGSGCYSVQGLWTQAREGLDVTTIICANRTYAILKLEMARQRIPASGTNARRLTELDKPHVEWTKLAEGFGVPAVQVTTAEELADAMRQSFETTGPMLIEALLS